MNRYLLDTNHLSGYLDRQPALAQRVDLALRAGDRFGICLPVLCEYHAGILLSRRYPQNLARLKLALARLRIWPSDEETAVLFADLYREARLAGRVLSQFDLLIAALTRQHKLILLTEDKDFTGVSGITIENWL